MPLSIYEKYITDDLSRITICINNTISLLNIGFSSESSFLQCPKWIFNKFNFIEREYAYSCKIVKPSIAKKVSLLYLNNTNGKNVNEEHNDNIDILKSFIENCGIIHVGYKFMNYKVIKIINDNDESVNYAYSKPTFGMYLLELDICDENNPSIDYIESINLDFINIKRYHI